MFAVNGPSGPTQRNERRRRTDAELAAEERRRQDEAQRKREGFFQLKSAKTEAKSGGDAKEERGSERAESSGIFKGCRIVFNGRTGKVSSYYLAKLVQEHGGNVSSMQMITASRITHMVGCNLSAAKADKIFKKLGKLKFVTSDWILQSVRQNKRLPEYEFLVYKDERGAAALKAAFTPNQHETPRDEKWQEKRKI